MRKKANLYLVKVNGGKMELTGLEVSLLQQSGMRVKVIRKLK